MSKYAYCYYLVCGVIIWTLVVAIGQSENPNVLFREILLFLQGDVTFLQVRRNPQVSFIAMTLGVFLAVNITINMVLPPEKHGAMNNLISKRRSAKQIFLALPAENFTEEFCFRYLPLGVLAPHFSGGTTYLIIFLVANVLWVSLHIPGNKVGMWLINIFIGGIFCGYIFAKYGLLVAVVFHVIANWLCHIIRLIARIISGQPIYST